MDQRAHLNRNLRFHPARAVSRPRPLVSSSTDDEQNLLLAFFPTVCERKISRIHRHMMTTETSVYFHKRYLSSINCYEIKSYSEP